MLYGRPRTVEDICHFASLKWVGAEKVTVEKGGQT